MVVKVITVIDLEEEAQTVNRIGDMKRKTGDKVTGQRQLQKVELHFTDWAFHQHRASARSLILKDLN